MAADVRALLRTLPLLGWLLRSPEEDEAIVRRSQAASAAAADGATAAAGGLCAAHTDCIGFDALAGVDTVFERCMMKGFHGSEVSEYRLLEQCDVTSQA